MARKFEVGKTYATRSICDYDTIFSYEVIARTEKTVTIKRYRDGKPARRGIFLYDGTEQIRPLGNYSMCPILSAEKDVK